MYFCIFCSHKFHKVENYFIFEMQKKIIWDPGSGKNLFQIPDPGVKKALDPGSRIRIRTTIHTNEIDSDPYPQPVLWNRNRRNRDFLP
jgi:hypothetical protein